jgi:hypothetical protein
MTAGASSRRERAERSDALVEPLRVGLPALGPGPLYPWFKLRLSDPVFYIVPILMWCLLALRHWSFSLPTAANPQMEGGGLFGESKMQGLGLFGPRAQRLLAPLAVLEPAAVYESAEGRLTRALNTLAAAGIEFPIIAKPDIGYQGWGVRRLRGVEDLKEYLAGSHGDDCLILQRYIAHEGEAGVFYIRHPDETRGRIASMAFTYAPHVTGDGRSSVAVLVGAHPVLRPNAVIYRERNPRDWDRVPFAGEVVPLSGARSARLGAIYRDGAAHVTPALEDAVEALSRDIPGFLFGRFDIRFASVEALARGEDFLVVELNGAGAEMLHIWDGRMTLAQAYRTLWHQYRTLFAIGAANRRAGHQPVGLRTMIRLLRHQERLRRGYPSSG